MKRISYLSVLLLITATLSAQTVKLKKEVVFVDEVPTFSFEKKAMGNELHVYKLNTKEELWNMVVVTNNTESKVDDSKKIIFDKQKVTIQSKDFRGRNFESLITLLLEGKILDAKGEIDTENLQKVKLKFDDRNINHVNKY